MPEIESINRRLEELEGKTKENFKMINEIKASKKGVLLHGQN